MNRKATFAKRQREMDLKDHQKAKEARRVERRNNPNAQKGPVIAWDEQVQVTVTPDNSDGTSLVPRDDTAAGATPTPSTDK